MMKLITLLMPVLLFASQAKAQDGLPLAACDALTAVTQAPDGSVWVASARGQLLRSVAEPVLAFNPAEACGPDFKRFWQPIGPAIDGAWTGLLTSNNEVLASAYGPAVWRSGSQTWDALAPIDDRAVMAILPAKADAGSLRQRSYMVGMRGLYWVSVADAGVGGSAPAWQLQTLYIDPEWEEPEDFTLNAIVPVGEGVLVAGEAGALYWSDNGDDWQKDNAGYDGTWFNAIAVGDKAVAFGLLGHVAVTTGYGGSWRLLQAPAAKSLFAGLVVDEKTLLLAGEQGKLWRFYLNENRFEAVPTPLTAAITGLLRHKNNLLLTTSQGVAVLPDFF